MRGRVRGRSDMRRGGKPASITENVRVPGRDRRRRAWTLPQRLFETQCRRAVGIIVRYAAERMIAGAFVQADGALVVLAHFEPQRGRAVRPRASFGGLKQRAADPGAAGHDRDRIEPRLAAVRPPQHDAAADHGSGLFRHQHAGAAAADQAAECPARDTILVEGGQFQRREGVEIGRAGRADCEGHVDGKTSAEGRSDCQRSCRTAPRRVSCAKSLPDSG